MHKLIPLLMAGALAGCATAPDRPAGPPPAGLVAPYTEAIELAGKLSVTYTREGRQEPLHGRFEWRQSAQRTDVAIYSPLGQTIAQIAVTPWQATLQESGKPPRTADNIDALSAQALGWTLPVSGLREWLQGYATAAHGKRFRASPQDATVVTADGWRLSYVSWQDVPGPPRPRRIDAERGATGQLEAMVIHIVIDPPAQSPP